MRFVRIVFALALLSLPLVVTPSASALDICDAAECQPPPAEQNSPYEFAFEAEEGCVPYRFSYSSGTVPPGLTVRHISFRFVLLSFGCFPFPFTTFFTFSVSKRDGAWGSG